MENNNLEVTQAILSSRNETSPTMSKFFEALAKFQGDVENVPHNKKNPHVGNTYADLAAIWATIRKPLAAAQLSVVQNPTLEYGDLPEAKGTKITVETTIGHASGEFIKNILTMPVIKMLKGGGWIPSAEPQAVGAIISYARRYAISSLLGLATEEDTDAELHDKDGDKKQDNKPHVYKMAEIQGLANPELKAALNYLKANAVWIEGIFNKYKGDQNLIMEETKKYVASKQKQEAEAKAAADKKAAEEAEKARIESEKAAQNEGAK